MGEHVQTHLALGQVVPDGIALYLLLAGPVEC